MRVFLTFIIFGFTILLVEPSSAETFADYRAAAKAAKTAYQADDIKSAADHTLSALELFQDDDRYSYQTQKVLIEQYLMLQAEVGDTDVKQRAAKKMKPYFERLAMDTGLGTPSIRELGDTMAGMLKGRLRPRDVKKANDWLSDLYTAVSDDPWVAVSMELRRVTDMRSRQEQLKTLREFRSLSAKADAIDPNHYLARSISLAQAKFTMERGKIRSGRKQLYALVEEWKAVEDPPELLIIRALGLIAGTYANAKKFDDMEDVYAQMMAFDKPKACEPIPIYRPRPNISCPGCGKDGRLVLEFDILDDGSVGSLEILSKEAPDGALKDVKTAMNKWRYYPAISDGTPVVTHGHKVQFSIIGSQ